MRYIKLFEELGNSKDKVMKACEDLKLKNYKINDDLSVDVDDHVIIENRKFSKLPINFGTIGGDFIIKHCDNLTTLKGCPKIVYCNFGLTSNHRLINIDYLPFLVSGHFTINHGGVLKIDNYPNKIGGDFELRGVNMESVGDLTKTEIGGKVSLEHLFELITLEGCPKEVEGDFIVTDCINLESLKYCPEKIGGRFFIGNSKIKSLEGCPKEVNSFELVNNRELTTLKYCPERVNGMFRLWDTTSLNTFKYFPKEVRGEVKFIVHHDPKLLTYPLEISDKLNKLDDKDIFNFVEEMNNYGLWNSDGTFNSGRYEFFKDDYDI